MEISPSDSRIGELSQNKVTPADHIQYVVQKYGHFFLSLQLRGCFLKQKVIFPFLLNLTLGSRFMQPNISSWTSNSPLHFFKVGLQCFSNETI